jgi:PadR family transcriptional regulator PadR
MMGVRGTHGQGHATRASCRSWTALNDRRTRFLQKSEAPAPPFIAPDGLIDIGAVRPSVVIRLISVLFPFRYPRVVTDGPIRVTEPLLDVLDALLEARDYELYGWAITKATKRSSPTIYKILERLTDCGMVTARWEEQDPDSSRPRRRFYKLTGHGAGAAISLLQQHRPPARRPVRPRPAAGWAGA